MMKKNRLLMIMGIMLFINFFTVKAQQYKVTPILQNGNPETTYNLVILAEAFKEDQMDSFIEKANLVDDVLKSNPVYNSLIDKMNIYAVSTPSVDGEISLIALNPSESDPIQTTSSKNTAFGIYFQNSYRAYLFGANSIKKARRVAAENVPFADNVLILVNGTQGQELSGRASSFEYTCAIGVNDFTSEWEQYLLIHELSHSLAGLSDEYASTIDEGFNVTTNNDPNTIRWKNFLSNPEVEIKSINPGLYIPNPNCLMNAYGTQYFCPVCADRISSVIKTDKTLKVPGVHRMILESEDLENSIFKFSWDPIPGATNYEVIYTKNVFSNGSATSTVYSQTTSTNEITFDLPGSSVSNFNHNIKIRAYNDNYSSHFIAHRVAFKRFTPITFNVPSNIKVSDRTSTSFKLEWNSETASEGSLIRLWDDKGVVSEILTDLRSVTLNNLEAGANYKIQLAAVKPFDIALNYSSPFSENINVDLSLSVNENNNGDKIRLYPNPTTNSIHFSNLKNSENYKIYNMNTQEVKSGKITVDNNSIDVRNLPKGAYFIRITDKGYFKFIKE